MKTLKALLTTIPLCLFLFACSPERPTPDAPLETQHEYAEMFPDPDDVVAASFSRAILDQYSITDGLLKIVLKDPDTVSDYFESGDKLNKLFAIEPVRMFYKIPDIIVIEMTANIAMGYHHLNVAKAQVEKFYGISIDGLREFSEAGELMIADKWRRAFLSRFDSKGKRAEFAREFVKTIR